MEAENDRAAPCPGGDGFHKEGRTAEERPTGLKSSEAPPENQAFSTPTPNGQPKNLIYALAYAKRGIPVFPCDPKTKAPLTQKGFYDATTDPEKIRTWWKRWSNAIIGIPTGRASGRFVIDVDIKHGKNGFETLAALEAEYGPLPETLTAVTPSGGEHRYFLMPDTDPLLGNTASSLGPGLDTRGQGGFTIVVPSEIDGRAYKWISEVRSPAALPAKWIDLLQGLKPKPKNQPPQEPTHEMAAVDSAHGGTPYGLAALDGCYDEMLAAVEGERNDTLNRLSFRVGALVAGGELTEAAAEYLKTAALQTGLTHGEIEKTFMSGFQKGLQHPAKATERAARGRQSKGNGQAYTDTQASRETPPEAARARHKRDTEGKPIIYIRQGAFNLISNEFENAILANNQRQDAVMIFQRNGVPVRVGRLGERSKKDSLGRPAHALGIFKTGVPYLLKHMASVATALKWSEKKRDYIPSDIPREVANLLLDSRGELHFPDLLGIVTAPTLRQDFSLLQTEGYDKSSGLYVDFGGVAFPEIPLRPTREEAMKAVEKILDLLEEFPFVKTEEKKEYSKAVAVAFLLTSLIRRILPTAPGFVLSAPQAGTGKSFLVECVCMLAFGYESIAPIPFSDDVDEQRKLFLSFAIEGPEVIFFDNAERIIGGEVLCLWLTSSIFKGRGLGKNETVFGPTNSLMVFTGNNATIKADATRRFLLCEMDAQVDCPEFREFKKPDLLGFIRDNRHDLVASGLTWILAYLAAEDKPQLTPYGSYEVWSSLIRGAVLWAGLDDPLGSREAIQAKDPEREALIEIQLRWMNSFNLNECHSVNEALKESEIAGFFENLGGKQPNPKSAGRWLSKRLGRVVNHDTENGGRLCLRFETSPFKTGGIRKFKLCAVP